MLRMLTALIFAIIPAAALAHDAGPIFMAGGMLLLVLLAVGIGLARVMRKSSGAKRIPGIVFILLPVAAYIVLSGLEYTGRSRNFANPAPPEYTYCDNLQRKWLLSQSLKNVHQCIFDHPEWIKRCMKLAEKGHNPVSELEMFADDLDSKKLYTLRGCEPK